MRTLPHPVYFVQITNALTFYTKEKPRCAKVNEVQIGFQGPGRKF